jgi:hypothetical protein
MEKVRRVPVEKLAWAMQELDNPWSGCRKIAEKFSNKNNKTLCVLCAFAVIVFIDG